MKNNFFFANARSGVAPGFLREINQIKLRIERYPRSCFLAMLLSMATSAALSFTVFRKTPSPQNPSIERNQMPGFPSTGINASALMEVMALQAELKGFIEKKVPDQADSIKMEGIIKRIQQLNQSLK